MIPDLPPRPDSPGTYTDTGHIDKLRDALAKAKTYIRAIGLWADQVEALYAKLKKEHEEMLTAQETAAVERRVVDRYDPIIKDQRKTIDALRSSRWSWIAIVASIFLPSRYRS